MEGAKPKLKPVGESVFERYLTNLSLTWDYEPLVGTKRPDYLILVKPDLKVLVEVEDFTGSSHELSILDEIAAGRNPAGPWDPIKYINRAIRDAAAQLKPGKGTYPCVAVLYNDATMPYDNELFVTQAMFGRLKITQLVGPEGAMSEAESVYSPDERYLTPKQNTTISAVAVLEEIQPNIHILREAEQELFARIDAEEPPDDPYERGFASVTRKAKKALPQLELLRAELERQYGAEFLDKTCERLRIYHNPWAAVPLPAEALNGEYDEHLYYDLERRTFTRHR